jgi:sporulation protein YlmC with PRC-barrel domain
MKRFGIASVLIIMFFMAANVLATDSATQKSSYQQRVMSGGEGMPMDMVKVSDILDKDLVNAQGEELGEVKDLIFDKNGEVGYLIISRGGVLGVGDDLVPIPWSAARVNFQDDKLVVNIDKAKLDQAPTFKSDNWNDFFSSGRQDEVRGYYGTQGSHGMRPGTEESSAKEGMQPGKSHGMETREQPQTTTPKTQ